MARYQDDNYEDDDGDDGDDDGDDGDDCNDGHQLEIPILKENSHQGRAPPRGRRSSAAPGRGGREGPRAA